MTAVDDGAVAGRLRAGLGALLLVGLVSGAIAALATVACLSLLTPPRLKLATIDVTGLVASEVARLQESGMEAAKAEAYAELWGPLLERSVQDIADEYGVVLLVDASVVAGAPDMTAVLKARLDHEVARFQ